MHPCLLPAKLREVKIGGPKTVSSHLGGLLSNKRFDSNQTRIFSDLQLWPPAIFNSSCAASLHSISFESSDTGAIEFWLFKTVAVLPRFLCLNDRVLFRRKETLYMSQEICFTSGGSGVTINAHQCPLLTSNQPQIWTSKKLGLQSPLRTPGNTSKVYHIWSKSPNLYSTYSGYWLRINKASFMLMIITFQDVPTNARSAVTIEPSCIIFIISEAFPMRNCMAL